MNKNDKLLTIGQFAAMHEINKKTLMWYNEIGLFSPAVIHPENGYRYYNYHQSPILETILLLRELDVSIDEIQEFMKNRSAARLKDLLDEKIAELDQHITHLNAVRKNLCTHRQNMITLLTMDLSEINIVQKEARCLIIADVDKNTSFENEVELITAKTKKYQLGRLHDASYGSMIPVASLRKGEFDRYTKLFIEIPFVKQESMMQMQENDLYISPAGKYLRAFHRGTWDGIPSRYKAILDYAEKHKLELYDYSYEIGINENVIDRIEDYIVQIEVPIRE